MAKINKGDVGCEFTAPGKAGDSGTWLITCKICQNEIAWRYPKPIVVAKIFTLLDSFKLKNAGPASPPAAFEELSITCPYKRPLSPEDCATQYSIKYDPNNIGTQNEIVNIKISPTTDLDRFWTDYGKKIVSDNLELLDKRSEYMITTIAALIATNFAVLVGFGVSGDFTLRIAPNIFLALSAAFFAIAHFPMRKEIQIQSPSEVRKAHEDWVKHKNLWQRVGYGFFVVGLFFIGMTYLVSQDSGPNVQNIKGDFNLKIVP